jgi:hypothetical protein
MESPVTIKHAYHCVHCKLKLPDLSFCFIASLLKLGKTLVGNNRLDINNQSVENEFLCQGDRLATQWLTILFILQEP